MRPVVYKVISNSHGACLSSMWAQNEGPGLFHPDLLVDSDVRLGVAISSKDLYSILVLQIPEITFLEGPHSDVSPLDLVGRKSGECRVSVADDSFEEFC